MIRLELVTLVLFYVFCTLGVIFSAWVALDARRRKREKDALRNRVQCTICASIFEDKTSVSLPRCPHCGSLNERRKLERL